MTRMEAAEAGVSLDPLVKPLLELGPAPWAIVACSISVLRHLRLLPALAGRPHLDAGDEVFVVATDEGLLITPDDPTLEKAMEAYRRGATKHENALRELSR